MLKGHFGGLFLCPKFPQHSFQLLLLFGDFKIPFRVIDFDRAMRKEFENRLHPFKLNTRFFRHKTGGEFRNHILHCL